MGTGAMCSLGSQECRGQMISHYDGGVAKKKMKWMGKQEKREAERSYWSRETFCIKISIATQTQAIQKLTVYIVF